MGLNHKIGRRDSDSFVSVTEAIEILRDLPDDTETWEALNATQQEYRLKLAAQLMGMLPWRGRKVYGEQALCFPRSVQRSRKSIPVEIKEAQAQIAYSVVHRSLGSRPAVSEGELGDSRVSSVSLGGLLTMSFSGDGSKIGNVLDMISRSVQFPIYLRLKKYLSQIRGSQAITVTTYTLSTTTTSTSTSSTSSTTTTTS